MQTACGFCKKVSNMAPLAGGRGPSLGFRFVSGKANLYLEQGYLATFLYSLCCLPGSGEMSSPSAAASARSCVVSETEAVCACTREPPLPPGPPYSHRLQSFCLQELADWRPCGAKSRFINHPEWP